MVAENRQPELISRKRYEIASDVYAFQDPNGGRALRGSR